jgi:high-affinity Fe2+/Pb2+ permease
MLATLVIFLREGVEASMIVAILLAYLNRIGRREHFRDVFLGVGAALVLATAGPCSMRPFAATTARACRRSSRP